MMKPLLTCMIEIAPVPWTRTGGGRSKLRYTPKRLRDYENALSFAIRASCPDRMILGPVQVNARFFLKRPKRLQKKDSPRGPVPHPFKPDIDNLLKAVKDAITKSGIWKDDSQAYSVKTSKYYAEIDKKPRIEIEIWPEATCSEHKLD